MKSYTIYKGAKFTIEWYVDEKGYSQAYDFFEESSEVEQDKILALFKLMANIGKIFDVTKFRNEGEEIFAFKSNQQDRYLCFFFKGGKIIVTNAFVKKSQKIPPREKSRALNIKKNYHKRILEGTYYEEEN
jgi:phage-related protein